MRRALPLFGLALLLTGCAADRPVSEAPSRPAALPPAATPSAVAAPPPALDPLTTSASADPLTTATSDPLVGDGGGSAKDALAGSDPLRGAKMPTDHSHWLRGQVRGGHVAVSLNGIRLGDFSGFVDRDITMRLRAGSNTVAFTYQPVSAHSSASLDVLEGEHTPPIAPLATFDAAPTASLSTPGTPRPQTQTVTFTAR